MYPLTDMRAVIAKDLFPLPVPRWHSRMFLHKIAILNGTISVRLYSKEHYSRDWTFPSTKN